VDFFNASVLDRREEGVAPVLEGDRSMCGGSWSPRRGANRGCSGREPESGSV
jgi:hypothetical protein